MPGPRRTDGRALGLRARRIGCRRWSPRPSRSSRPTARPQVVVTGTAVQPLRPTPVRIDADDSVPPSPARPTRGGGGWPRGRRAGPKSTNGSAGWTAAATPTRCPKACRSSGRWCSRPPGGVVGVENPEPTSVLDQLARCGAISADRRGVDDFPPTPSACGGSRRDIETHPVAELAGTRLHRGDPRRYRRSRGGHERFRPGLVHRAMTDRRLRRRRRHVHRALHVARQRHPTTSPSPRWSTSAPHSAIAGPTTGCCDCSR